MVEDDGVTGRVEGKGKWDGKVDKLASRQIHRELGSAGYSKFGRMSIARG